MRHRVSVRWAQAGFVVAAATALIAGGIGYSSRGEAPHTLLTNAVNGSCAESELVGSLAVGGVAGQGQGIFRVELRNIGASTCTLDGTPTVDAVSSSGTLLSSTPATMAPFGTYEASDVSLDPGSTVESFVYFEAGSCGLSPTLAVTPPGAGTALTISSSSGISLRDICGSKTFLVSPLVPASVQPFSSYPPASVPTSPPTLSAPTCTNTNLNAAEGQIDGSSLEQSIEVVLTNASARACEIGTRWPTVEFLDASGSSLGFAKFTGWLPSYISQLGASTEFTQEINVAPNEDAIFFIEIPPASKTLSCAAAAAGKVTVPQSDLTVSIPLSGSIPICGDAGGRNPSVTPIVMASAPSAKIQPPVVLTGDGSGYYYGTDSGSVPCADSSPWQINYNGLSGACGFYGGQLGAYWGLISGCSNSGWAWESSQANAADNNYSTIGSPGTSGLYFLGGAGADPKLDPGGEYAYSGGTPSNAQVQEAFGWGGKQAYELFNTDANYNNGALYQLTQPIIFMDIEQSSGWDGEYSGCQAYTDNTRLNGVYSKTLNREVFDGFFDWITNHESGYSLGAYTSGPFWSSYIGGSNLSTVYEWANETEATSQASGTNRPTSFSWSEAAPEFFAGYSSSSSRAVAWQWATPPNTLGQTEDLDQVLQARFPAP